MFADLVTVMTLALAPQGPTTTFFDDTFDNGRWTTTDIIVGPGTTSSATGAQVQAGNPAPAWRSTHTFVAGAGSTTVWAIHMSSAAVYDPSGGAIAEVHSWLDHRSTINTRAQAALTQGSQVYISLQANWLTGGNQTSWATRGPDTSTAQDFVELLPNGSYALTSHPDFTTAGAPIMFGFVTGNSTATTVTYEADWDNFRIGLNGAPAGVAVRLGTPPNPDVLRPVSGHGPVIGTSWGPVVDHSTFLPNATLDFLAFGFHAASTASPYGAVLCSPLVDGFGLAAGQPFVFPIPNDTSFLGATLCLQAGSGDPAQGVFQLTNALDVTIGTY